MNTKYVDMVNVVKIEMHVRKTKDFPIQDIIDYLSRIWHNFLEVWILNALQLCTCLAL